jgi:hypothetical protein
VRDSPNSIRTRSSQIQIRSPYNNHIDDPSRRHLSEQESPPGFVIPRSNLGVVQVTPLD